MYIEFTKLGNDLIIIKTPNQARYTSKINKRGIVTNMNRRSPKGNSFPVDYIALPIHHSTNAYK